MNKKQISIRKWVHRLFEIGIWGKGIDGVLELLGGFFIFFESPQNLSQWLVFLTQHEWSNPDGAIPSFLLRLAENLTRHTQTVAAVYLWGHGAIKVGLMVGLFTRHRPLYPWAMFFLGVFSLYQFERYFKTGSVGYLVVALFDLFVIPLVYLEYQRLKARTAVR